MKYIALILVLISSASCAPNKVLMKKCEHLGKQIFECEKL